MNKPQCVLTGYKDSGITFNNSNPLIIDYTFLPIGRVRITRPTYEGLLNEKKFKNPELAGICRNAFVNGEAPPLIDTNFLMNGIKNYWRPTEFKEKAHHLLRYLYFHGGKDYKLFDLHSYVDYPLCYCTNDDEFDRVVDYLSDKGFITFREIDTSYGLGHGRYSDLRLTLEGIEEVEKELPDVPLVGLVNQSIETGNPEVDKQINHARYLFFHEPRSMEKLRSACETLIFVLEPLRNELPTFFSQKDVNAFFQIVNSFDVRHNKEFTQRIEHPEQLEWVFYSLLNTINAYVKLKRKTQV